MTDEPKIEKPVVEKTDNPEPKPAAEPQIDIDALVSELKAAGISDPEQLQGKLQASRQTGHLQNLLGEQNRQIKQLQDTIESLKQKPQATENYDYAEGQPIDIETAIERGVEKVISKRETAQQQKQKMMLEAWDVIQNDEDYKLIAPVWEEKLKDPNFAFKVNNGVVDPVRAYQETVRQYYKGMMKRSLDTITTLKQGVKIETPHVEQGDRTAAGLPPEPTETQEKIKQLKDRVDKGGSLTEAEELDALQKILAGQ